MIFRYDIRSIDGRFYITGSQLINGHGSPYEEFEFTRPFTEELIDGNHKFQWRIRENPDYNPEIDHIDDRYIIECDPIQPTPGELKAEKQTEIKRQLVDELPDIILQNKDNPEALAQKLCNRAKQIEVENETRRDRETFRS